MYGAREEVPVLDAPQGQLERCRPRRIQNLSPAPIPLADLAPAIGIAAAAVISGTIWLIIGCVLYFG